MNLTRVANLGVLLVVGFLFAATSFANEVEVTAKTDLFGQGKNKKPTKVGTALPGSKYKVISTKGAWTAINFNGKSVWIASKNVRPVDGGEFADNGSGDREPASWNGGSTEAKYGVHADIGMQTGGSGIAPGFGGWFRVAKLNPTMAIDVGPSLFFFPSTSGSTTAGASASAFEILMNGRLRYSLAPKMHLNGELGLVYFSASSSVTVGTTTVSGSASTVGVNLGGTFQYEFARQWNAVAGLRMVFAGGSAALLSGGVEYTF